MRLPSYVFCGQRRRHAHRQSGLLTVLRRIALVFLLSAVTILPGACRECAPPPPPGEGEQPAEGEVQEGEDMPQGPELLTYHIVQVFPHDAGAFTQGLVYEDGIFFEGTGLYGKSSLRRVNPENGAVLQQVDLDAQYFGEGIAVVGERIFQLTWQENTAFVYDKHTFALLDQFNFSGEGWGLTYDGVHLILSDGTSSLRYFDPATYQELGEVEVRDGVRPVTMLNELEYIAGEVYANVWQTDRIARIDPSTGQVTAWLNLAGLLRAAGGGRAPDVLNGIAYDAAGDRLFVTGKKWPHLFEIDLEPAPRAQGKARRTSAP